MHPQSLPDSRERWPAPECFNRDLFAVATRREGGTEVVPHDVHALRDPRHPLSAVHRFDHAITRDWRPVRQSTRRARLASAEQP